MPTYAMTVIPAYGRDYKTAKAAIADWNAGKDFRCSSYNQDGYTSIRDWIGKHVAIRYNKLTQITIVKCVATSLADATPTPRRPLPVTRSKSS